MNHGVVLFHTTTSALRGEKTLKKAGFPVKLIPTPRELSSDCGFVIEFQNASLDAIQAALTAAGLEFEIHPLP